MKAIIVTLILSFPIISFCSQNIDRNEFLELQKYEAQNPQLQLQVAGKCGSYYDKQGREQYGCTNDVVHGVVFGVLGALIGSFNGTSGAVAGGVVGFGLGYVWSNYVVNP